MSFQWDVARVTTDKLDEELNGAEDWWEIHQIQYIGGRDWVVIYRNEIDGTAYTVIADQHQTTRASGPERWWEITIPSMGPNDEPLMTRTRRRENVEREARAAIAETHGLTPELVKIHVTWNPIARDDS